MAVQYLFAQCSPGLQESLKALAEAHIKFGEDKVQVKLITDPSKAPVPQPKFRSELVTQQLRTSSTGRLLLSCAEISSTQTFLQENMRSFPDGTVCVADAQTAGKGRGKNTWTSPPGCLMFSMYKVLELPGDRLPFVQYVVSLALVRAVHKVTGIQAQAGTGVRIKWPNDLYSNGLKLGGILCHSVYREAKFHLVVGAGINVTNREPSICVQQILEDAAAEERELSSGKMTQLEDVLAAFLNEVEPMLETLAQEGFRQLQAQYIQSWLHTNQQVTLQEGPPNAVQEVQLTIKGLTDCGYMLAINADGERFELHPDGNSLDFFKGLMCHKQ